VQRLFHCFLKQAKGKNHYQTSWKSCNWLEMNLGNEIRRSAVEDLLEVAALFEILKW
jgi:hypothetical protein